MTPADALKTLTGIALEYTNGLKAKPCTQEALMLRIQLAHNVLNLSLNPPAPIEVTPVDPTHDRDPT